MTRSRRQRWSTAAVLGWSFVLVLVLLWPMLTRGGSLLARDLVFLPRHQLGWPAAGLADTAPRAVPLDAAVGLLTHVVDGRVLGRVLLPGLLLLAVAGLLRLGPRLGPVGGLVLATVAVWNPFVVERLALGQWALLAAYAALPWALAAGARWLTAGAPASLLGLLGWSALASVTPTGGLLAVAATVVSALLAWGVPTGRRVLATLAVLGLQAPWLVASLMGTGGGSSDPAGVAAFAPDTEGGSGVLVALLGLGGIWDARSEPGSRTTVLAVVTAVVVVAVLVGGFLVRRRGEPGSRTSGELSLAVLGAGGLSLAALAATGPGADLLRWAVATLPGAGLLRDGQKWLLPLALVAAGCAGLLADAGWRWVSSRWPDARDVLGVGVVPLVLLPVVLLPDAAGVVWSTVRPVDLPAGLPRVAEIVAERPGDVATLPWRSYRGFGWGNGETSSDPALRLLPGVVVVDDDLRVGETVVQGESRRARAVGEAAAARRPARALAAEGIAWVLVYRDEPGADEVRLDGLEPVYADRDVELLRVPGAPGPTTPSVTARGVLGTAYGLPLLMLLGVAGWAAVSARRGTPRGSSRIATNKPADV